MAVFVTAHGFGHAARACALVEALHRARPDLEYLFVGQVAAWFLEDSLPRVTWRQRPLATDVGPVQRTSLSVDLDATRERVRRRVPPSAGQIEEATDLLAAKDVRVVIADIAALGLVAGSRASLPTVLVENFTWDWIYRRMAPGDPVLGPAADWLEEAYAGATLRVQATPCCRPLAAALQVGSLARSPRRGRKDTRRELGIADDEVMALLSMGGVPWRYRGLEAIAAGLRPVVVGEMTGPVPAGVVRLDHRSRFHHPDLVAAADVVVGKLGYSTLAEAWRQGCPYLIVERTDFPEVPVLQAHARRVLPTATVPARRLQDGGWSSTALSLAARRTPRVAWEDGADAAAAAIVALL